MGYRSDVALVFSKAGWEALAQLLDGQHAAFSVEDCEKVIEFLNYADNQSIDSASGDNLLVWNHIKSYASDAALLFDKACHLIDGEQWYLFDLGEDGATEINGGYWDNPFDIGTTHSLNVSEGDIDMAGKKCGINPPVKMIGQLQVVPTSIVQKAMPTTSPVDNYTCKSCGNSKLNDMTDKICWKCGVLVK